MVSSSQIKNSILPGKASPDEKISLKKSDKGFAKELEKNQKKPAKRKEDEVAPHATPAKQEQRIQVKDDIDKSNGSQKVLKENSQSMVAVEKTNQTSPNSLSSVATDEATAMISGSGAVTAADLMTADNKGIESLAEGTIENTTAQGLDISSLEMSHQNLDSLSALEMLELKSKMMGVPLQGSTEGIAADTESSLVSDSLSELPQIGAIENTLGEKKEDLKDFSSQQENLADSLTSSVSDNSTLNIKDKSQHQFSKILDSQMTDKSSVSSQENVNALVSNVRSVIKEGGGEMVMKLTPEGMGTIDLKVGVDSGVVSVQMTADNLDAKNIIENSMSDIRLALEGQNIKVDMLKVDISDTFKDLQNQQNMMDQQFARNFMGQFREDRQSFRQQSLGMDLEKFPTTANGPQGLQPAQARSVNPGRLNVVA